MTWVYWKFRKIWMDPWRHFSDKPKTFEFNFWGKIHCFNRKQCNAHSDLYNKYKWKRNKTINPKKIQVNYSGFKIGWGHWWGWHWISRLHHSCTVTIDSHALFSSHLLWRPTAWNSNMRLDLMWKPTPHPLSSVIVRSSLLTHCSLVTWSCEGLFRSEIDYQKIIHDPMIYPALS